MDIFYIPWSTYSSVLHIFLLSCLSFFQICSFFFFFLDTSSLSCCSPWLACHFLLFFLNGDKFLSCMQLNLAVFSFLLFFVPGSRNSSPTSNHEDTIFSSKMLFYKLDNATSYLFCTVGLDFWWCLTSQLWCESVPLVSGISDLPLPLCIYIPPSRWTEYTFPGRSWE